MAVARSSASALDQCSALRDPRRRRRGLSSQDALDDVFNAIDAEPFKTFFVAWRDDTIATPLARR